MKTEIKLTILDDGGAALELGETRITMSKEEMWEIANLFEAATCQGVPGDVFQG